MIERIYVEINKKIYNNVEIFYFHINENHIFELLSLIVLEYPA